MVCFGVLSGIQKAKNQGEQVNDVACRPLTVFISLNPLSVWGIVNPIMEDAI